MSGTFRDPADFAVVVLYDADNFYEHPSIKYLPDFDFSGLSLRFRMQYTDGLQPIDSPKFNWIDWATLDCVLVDGSTPQVRLWDHAMLADADFPAASGSCTVVTSGGGVEAYDRVTLWYQNVAFDYIVPEGQKSVEFAFFAIGNGHTHFITVNGRTYSHTEATPAGESSAAQAAALLSQMGGDPDVEASLGSGGNTVRLTVRDSSAGLSIPVSASDGNGSTVMRLTTAELAAEGLVEAVNATDWVTANTTHALLASRTGAQITLTAARYGTVNVSGAALTLASGTVFSGITVGSTILVGGVAYTVASVESPTRLTLTSAAAAGSGVAYVAPRGGRDGNLIRLYATSKTATLGLDQSEIVLSGGRSDVAWDCTLDFTALGIDQLRQCWLTFAPSLVAGSYAATEWEAVFSNWQLTGPEDTKKLVVAGPGSVRVEQSDKACVFAPASVWTEETGFYSKYFAKVTSDSGATVTASYTCQFAHDLYLGTSLDVSRGVVWVRVDADAETSLDCRLATTGSPVGTRRLLRSGVAAGKHTVAIRMKQAGPFYFDFLEAAVASDFPDAPTGRTGISPALDYDTDHTYKLSPARLLWIFDKLGYAGPMNEYLGVFWWNRRVASGGAFAAASATFAGTFAEGETVSLTVNGVTIRKSVYAADTSETIALHFRNAINSAFVGAWAAAAAGTVTVTQRSPAAAYALTLSTATTSAMGTATVTQAPTASAFPVWVVDDAAEPLLTRSARDWHADFYAECQSRGREVVTACSMELVNPPEGYVARFPDPLRTAVATATGFGTLVSNHCAAGSAKMLAYQKAVYREIAQLQVAAGLTPAVQYGEFLWWYFALADDLEVGYASYSAPISIGTAKAHGLSTGASVVITGVKGNTAANGTWTITVTDATHFTLDGSSGSGDYTSGGAIFGGGMGFYDDETMAAAMTVLGRPLHVFNRRDEDPGVNGGADALFLRNRLRDHVAELVADIRSAYPAVKCEVLWPYDVNYPTPVPVGAPYLGGALVRAVNLPAEWKGKASSGLDRMKVEALAFGSSMRNLDLAREAIKLFPGFGWPLDSVRYLVPVFGAAAPWHRELAMARGAGLTVNNLWAFDHVCLYNLDVPERGLERRSVVRAG